MHSCRKESSEGGVSPDRSEQGPGRAERCSAVGAQENLFISAVAFLPLLQVAVAAALPPVHDPGVGHVEETLATPGGQVALQLPLVAVVEHARERMPGGPPEEGKKQSCC